eukprot:COSAG01_NODE_365_length_18082_cov_9.136518_8_plen_64_part_00
MCMGSHYGCTLAQLESCTHAAAADAQGVCFGGHHRHDSHHVYPASGPPVPQPVAQRDSPAADG